MLTLGRHLDQDILIRDMETGETIVTIKVCRLQPGKVRLGFTADKRYQIVRAELLNQAGGFRGE